MNHIKTINEMFRYDNRAKVGNVLEVEVRNDGKFFWHTPEDDDWEKMRFNEMNEWEIRTETFGNTFTFYIKIGNPQD